ncbi:MAG: Transcriptional regulator, AbrB family [Hyphomicrobiales bacterium]|nr:Transcriptional regulator, AbrB family [Hyphomicrobiales bacterium]
MSAATMTSKGQVTLPADIRREFDLQAGDRLVFFRALSGDLRLHISRKRVGAGRGMAKGKNAGSLDRETLGASVARGVAKRRGAQARS